MMCSLLLVRENKHQSSRFGQSFERGFARLRANYERTLDWALRHPAHHDAAAVRDHGLNIYMYIANPRGFFPQQGYRPAAGRHPRAMHRARFQLMKRKLQEVAAIIQADPAVNTVTGSVGRRRRSGPSAAAARAPT